jgi:hypothetical protein
MSSLKRGGLIQIAVNGFRYDCKGEFTSNLGRAKREAIIGVDKVHGFTEKPQVAFIEGKITDRGDLDRDALVNMVGATVTMLQANGKDRGPVKRLVCRRRYRGHR